MSSLNEPSIFAMLACYGTLLIACVLLAGFCIVEFVKKEILWTLPAAGLSAAAAGIVVFYIAILDQDLPLNPEFMSVASAIFWCGTCFAFTFGPVGLIRVNSLENPAGQGRRYAWLGMLLALLLQFGMAHAASVTIAAGYPHEALKTLEEKLKAAESRLDQGAQGGSGSGAAGGDQASEKDGYKIFTDLNFKFKIPDSPWFEMNLKSLAPHSAVSYMRTDLLQTMMINVEKTTALEGKTMAMVGDIVAQVSHGPMPDLKILSQEEFRVNDLPGYKMTVEGTAQGQALRYIWWLYYQGGFFYQFSLWQTQDKPLADLETSFKQLAPGFFILNTSPVSSTPPVDEFNDDFVSGKFGYRVKVKKSAWKPLPNQMQENPFADFVMIQDKVDFAVIPFVDPGVQDLSMDLLADAFLTLLSIDFKKIPSKEIKKVSEGGRDGYKINQVHGDGNSSFEFDVAVYKGKAHALMLVSGRPQDGSKNYKDLSEDAFKRFSFDKNTALVDLKNLTSAEKKVALKMLGGISKTLYDRGNVQQSEDNLKTAYEIAPEDGNVFENYVAMMMTNQHYQAALDLVEKNKDKYKDLQHLPRMEARLLYEAGRGEEALKKYRELMASGSKDAKLIQAYSDTLWALGKKEEALKAAEEYKASSSDSGDMDLRLNYVNKLIDQGDMDKALEELRKLNGEYPNHADVRDSLFNALQSSGKHAEAIEMSETEAREGRGDYKVYLYQGINQMQLNHYKDAQEAFEKAAKLQPADPTVKEYLKELEALLGYANLDEVMKPLDPVPIPEELRTVNEKAAEGFIKKDTSYYINLVSAIDFHPGQPMKRTDYRLIKVSGPHELSKFTEFELDYDSFRENIFVNALVVRNAKGEEIGRLDTSKFYIVDDSDAGYASHNKVLHVPIPGVEEGATLELMFTREYKQPDVKMPYQEILMRARHPVLQRQVILTGAVTTVKTLALNGVKFEDRKTYHRWVAEKVPAFKDSDYLPDPDRIDPMIKMGPLASDWVLEGDEYLEDMAGVLEPGPEIVKLASKLTQGLKTPEEKIDAIFEHLQNDYAYNAIEFGLRAMIPQRAEKTAAVRQGDCKDHALLLYQLLRASGLPANLALVRTNGKTEPDLARLEQFDHMIVYSPQYPLNPFLDATNKSMDPAVLASNFRHQQALILEQGRSHLVEMVPSKESVSTVRSHREMQMEGNDLKVTEKVTMEGYAAASFRSFFKAIQADTLTADFQRAFPVAAHWIIEKIEVENLSNRLEPLRFTLQYTVPNVFYYVGDKMAGQLPILWEDIYLDVSHDASRTDPFQFSYPSVIENQVRFTPPQGFSIDEKATAGGAITKGGDLIRVEGTSQVAAGVLESTLKTTGPEGIFPAADYEKARTQSKEALDALRLKIILTPVPQS